MLSKQIEWFKGVLHASSCKLLEGGGGSAVLVARQKVIQSKAFREPQLFV